ncbi:MAG: arylsulfatase [Opitutaceae bacterium]|nr:arylsulfatase [Opitutaceae bacterium]
MPRFLPLVLISLLASYLSAQTPSRASLPNIIFVMVDDMGYRDIGPYGQTLIATPNLDRMAREGLRFTQAYVGASVCAPSRSVLMTGQHLGHTRVRGNAGMTGGVLDQNQARRVVLEPEDVTVAQVLKARGYVTGMTGKWGLGEPGSTGEPNYKGFDEWFGFLNQNHAHTHYPDYLWRNQQKVTIEPNVAGKRGQHTHELFTNFAFDFIKRRSGGPFFLYLPYTLPHQEMAVPSLGAYADRPWSEEEKIHAAMISLIDRDMGRLFDLLKELKIDDQTVVFFTSDNGGARRYDGRFDSNAPLRGAKGDVFEGGLRAPLLVRWPGQVPAGKTSDLPCMFFDILPTLADLAGAPVPPRIDGVSLRPTLLGQRQELERMIYWEQYSGGFQQAVRWGQWKAIRRDGTPASFELYDLSADPGEKTSVAAAQPTVVQRIEKYMADAHTPSPNWSRRDAAAPKKPSGKKKPAK